MAKVVLPELGEGIEKATVSYWLIDVGQAIKEGDDLIEMATEKAVFNVPCSKTGTLKEKLVNDGDEVKVGDELAVIE